MADATYAYEHERYQDARRVLRVLSDEVPGSAAVRELYGLVLYRLGQWPAAARQLETFRTLRARSTSTPSWRTATGPSAATTTPKICGRTCAPRPRAATSSPKGASSPPGAGPIRATWPGAIELLERAARRVARAQERHLRQWYALADLYERAGDLPRARDLFSRVAATDPDAFDVRRRLRALR